MSSSARSASAMPFGRRTQQIERLLLARTELHVVSSAPCAVRTATRTVREASAVPFSGRS